MIRKVRAWMQNKQDQYFTRRFYRELNLRNDRSHAYRVSILILLRDIELYRRDDDGNLCRTSSWEVTDLNRFNVANVVWAEQAYDQKASWLFPTSLKKKWKGLLRETLDYFMEPFWIYFM